MKRMLSKIIFSAMVVIANPGKINAVSAPTQLSGIVAPPEPRFVIMNLIDKVLHWIFLPFIVLGILFYVLYLAKKSRKYLVAGNILIALMGLIIIAWVVFDLLGITEHLDWVKDLLM